jgi:putative FmdB family regulatory protein
MESHMPIFDYTCRDCGTVFEALVRRRDDKVDCPGCGEDSVVRVPVSPFSCTGIRLTKMLRMDAEDRLSRGRNLMQRQALRKSRIKIM